MKVLRQYRTLKGVTKNHIGQNQTRTIFNLMRSIIKLCCARTSWKYENQLYNSWNSILQKKMLLLGS